MKTNKRDLRNEIRLLHKIIFLKCLECCNAHQCSGQIKEVINCEILDCPLFNFRPKKIKGLYILAKQLKQKYLLNSEANKT